MTGTEIITYSLFAYSFIVAVISYGLVNDLRNPKSFKKCLTAAAVSFALGIILELTEVANLKAGIALVIMSLPIIYLGYFEALRRIFSAWKGKEPYVPATADAVGAPPI